MSTIFVELFSQSDQSNVTVKNCYTFLNIDERDTVCDFRLENYTPFMFTLLVGGLQFPVCG